MEAVGAAASGIALGQLCIGIAKAVRLWHSIEDLPLDLQDAVDRLEALGPVLQGIIDKLSSCEEEYGELDLQLPTQHAKACGRDGYEASIQLTEDTEAELTESYEAEDEACVGGVAEG
ncbi:uncharacterized protein ColSpa_01804 [Colletotrichum spaethianum]|uniref:Fungal N-terminal domain-containing protein n=1 Tax=Colletotrichum spaethianum TaxID=700344 RepID=A0AA37L467_9PEZI|nr:uncharacterized protein ColSpa_01804 [Colletotrichum spaethianum]GKT41623.1 hypothetical protein ColSpa_01804 [Colletotrichum spaethianum]